MGYEGADCMLFVLLLKLHGLIVTLLIDFKAKKIRVNLILPIKAEVKAESLDVLKAVVEDRKYDIQATIVRYVNLLSSTSTGNLIEICRVE